MDRPGVKPICRGEIRRVLYRRLARRSTLIHLGSTLADLDAGRTLYRIKLGTVLLSDVFSSDTRRLGARSATTELQ